MNICSQLKGFADQHDRRQTSPLGIHRRSRGRCLAALLAVIAGTPCVAADGVPRPAFGVALYFSVTFGAIGTRGSNYGLRLEHASADSKLRHEIVALRLSPAVPLRLQLAERFSWDFEEARWMVMAADRLR